MQAAATPILCVRNLDLLNVTMAILVLPMQLALGRRHALAAAEADRAAIEAAALALLSRGQHGSLGSYPGFLVSELGSLTLCVALVRSGALGRGLGWLGVAGLLALLAYSTALTFVPEAAARMLALAAPGGLLMIAWHVLVGRALLRLGRGTVAQAAQAPTIGAPA
jgi:hypothetical protein